MTHPTPPSTSHFSALKARALSLATALYGIPPTPPRLDLLPFSAPTAPPCTHGVALIFYIGPADALYACWEMLSYVDAQGSVDGAAQQLVEDLQRGMGGVIGGLVARRDWSVRHASVPDFARGGTTDGDSGGRLAGESEMGEERWYASLGGIEEVEEGDGR